MNWDAIGATGEWAGALAVVTSLIYLAIQVRQSNRQTQSSAEVALSVSVVARSFMHGFGCGELRGQK